MKKKPIMKENKKNQRTFRISLIFLAIAMLLIIIAVSILMYNTYFIEELYQSFFVNYISNVFMYTGGLFLFIYFLYLLSVIIFKNPQRIKKSRVIKFAIVGVIILCMTIIFINFSIGEISKGAADINSYSNKEWIVKEVEVTWIHRGTSQGGPFYRRSALIDTDDGEYMLYKKTTSIKTGNSYRITYLEETKTIIDFSQISK